MSTVPAVVQRDHPLARLTTIRPRGSAELFARTGTLSGRERLVAGAGAAHIEVGVAGLGSNLLVADIGVRGRVVNSNKELAKIEPDGTRTECGGGARLPGVSARAAQAGLSGNVRALGPVGIPSTWRHG